MSRIIRHAASPALMKKGMTHITELVPVAGDFRIKGAGKQLAVLFREELMRRLAKPAAAGKAGAP